jgi:lipoprotein-anchoring transpeptidase ErfK/SrfK
VKRCAGLVALLLLSGCVERTREQPPKAAQSATPKPAVVEQPQAPPGPPVRLFASRFVAKVREASNRESFRIGYLRGGALVQAMTAEPVGYDKCKKGWFGLETGGFVCSTMDAIAFTTKRLPERQPLQPDLSAPLPYPYGYSVRRNTPMYRRLPTDEEAARYEGYRIPGQAPQDTGPPAPTIDPLAQGPVAAVELPASVMAQAAAASLSLLQAPQAAGAPGSGEESEAQDPAVPTLASLMGEQGSVLMRRMERGFYVSLDRELEKDTRKYWRTQSNGFIPSKGLRLVTGSEFQGVPLKEQGIALPVAFVMSKSHTAYELTARGYLKPAGQPGYHHMLRIASTVELRGVAYCVDEQGLHYRAKDVVRIDARDKPGEIAADEKWIDIDLGAQSLVAYVGAEPIYATLISSGRIKDELNPLKNFETPSGSFRIKSKHLTATMDGDHAIDGPYSIEDVPYVMYFQLAYALHSAFWHNAFGRPHSHGCINLAPLDAKWIFEFADPPLPKGWHGAYPTPVRLGTRLYIHGTTPPG